MNDRHLGSGPATPGQRPGDRRVSELVERFFALQPYGRAEHTPLTDPYRILPAYAGRFAPQRSLVVGTVVHAVPHLNWYRVQLGEAGAVVGACALSAGGLMPVGPKDTGMFPAGSTVLVYRIPGVPYSVILGALPDPRSQGQVSAPDAVWQGGQTGLRREAADRQPLANLFRGAGILDFSAGRPYDATPFDRGLAAETGVGLHLDSFMAYLRVNEACGLFLNYWDDHTRLAGRQLLLESSGHEEYARHDEGEIALFRGEALNPWESLGLYAAGTSYAQAYDARSVQYDAPRGALDLPPAADDQEPFYRYREYGGYLGQGKQRFVVLPPRTAGVRRRADTEPEAAVFHDHVAVDGAYALQSAKSVVFSKHPVVVSPRNLRLPEDAEGDDARAGNYKFSGAFGDAEDHQVGDVDVPDGKAPGMLRAATLNDLVAYAHNWKGLHPFHYHSGDYTVPQASATPLEGIAGEVLNFNALADAEVMPEPEATKVFVDDRYQEVRYLGRGCHIGLLEDGGVVLQGGCGERIILSGGNIQIDAPGNVTVVAGKRAVVLGGDVILRAQNSLDASAATHDLRLKAERNMELLAGNSGVGGVLVESRSKSPTRLYQNKFGEDVVSSGVVLRAPDSEVVALAQDVYLRTGGDGPLGSGNITFDAGQGGGNVYATCRAFDVFNSGGGVSVWYSPSGTDAAAVNKSHYFGPQGVIFNSDVIVAGRVAVVAGDTSAALAVDGPIEASGSVATAGNFASRSGGIVPRVGDTFAADLSRGLSATAKAAANHQQAGQAAYQSAIVTRFYTTPGAVGSADTLSQMGFSFRDPPGAGAPQYRAGNFVFVEPLWSQLVRLGGAVGGGAWVEPPVSAQGVETYPWPGRAAWKEDDDFLRVASGTIYDVTLGLPKDRPSAYESPRVGPWEAVAMADGLKVLLK